MMNILLVCSAGMSTSMLVTKMQAAAEKRGMEAKIWAVGDAESSANIPNADVVLLGPQVRFLLGKTQAAAGDKPVRVIDMLLYGTMNGEKVLDFAINAIEEGKK
ncbi:MAG: PTS sugar transporter subunit IIB [Erysipelotrichaceae bacterium]